MSKKRIEVKYLALATVGLIVLGALGCNGMASGSQARQGIALHNDNRRERVVPWRSGFPSGSHDFTLVKYVGLCWHSQSPQVGKVTVHSMPHHRTVITLRIHFPPPPHPCAGVDVELHKRIHLSTPVRGEKLFDGSRTPPLLRWPK